MNREGLLCSHQRMGPTWLPKQKQRKAPITTHRGILWHCFLLGIHYSTISLQEKKTLFYNIDIQKCNLLTLSLCSDGMLIPVSAALFIVGSYLCAINTQPTFSAAINQNFGWNEIHSVQAGSRGPFHLTPHFSSRFCYHLTQWRASSFWRASRWNYICSLLEKSQFCSTAGPTRGFLCGVNKIQCQLYLQNSLL